MPKSQLDWLAVVGLWVGAIIEAIKAGDLQLITGAPGWLASHSWGYVPAILVTLYVVLALYRQIRPAMPQVAASEVVPTTPRPEAIAEISQKHDPAAPPPSSPPSKQEGKGRTFLSSALTPEALMDMCADKTDVHAERAMQPYIGKWMRYSGIVRNVYLIGTNAYIRFEVFGLRSVKAIVSNGSDLADVLHKGDKLTVDGRIEDISAVDFNLIDAEVVSR